jgi:hypothetical protein
MKDASKNTVKVKPNKSFTSKFFRSIDAFGYSVTLKYQNDSQYRSPFGGAVTLFLVIGLASFLIILLTRCIKNESYTVVSNFSKINTVLDNNRSLILDKNNFDISLIFSYSGRKEDLYE